MTTIYKKFLPLIFLNAILISSFCQNNNAIRFKIIGNGYSDETVVRLVNGATQNFDGNYDAWKLFSINPNVPSIYTQIATGQELSINALPEFNQDTSLTIYTNIPANGNYILQVEEIFPLTPNYKISLSDISSNTDFQLLGDTALTFSFNIQQNSPTFTFNISTPLISSSINESCINMDDGALNIENPGNDNWNVKIYDTANNLILNDLSTSILYSYNFLTPESYRAVITSKGIVDEVNFTIAPGLDPISSFNTDEDTVFLSQGGQLQLTNTSLNAQNYLWDFGDGGNTNDTDPTYNYTSIGDYPISLLSINGNCTALSTRQITVLQSPNITTSIESVDNKNFTINNYSNGNYQINMLDNDEKTILVYDIKGSIILNTEFTGNNYNLSLNNNSSGIYVLRIIFANGKVVQKKLFR